MHNKSSLFMMYIGLYLFAIQNSKCRTKKNHKVICMQNKYSHGFNDLQEKKERHQIYPDGQ